MDMLKLKSKLMLGIVESLLSKELSKALGENVKVSISDIDATVNEEGKLEAKLTGMKLETDVRIIKKLMGL